MEGKGNDKNEIAQERYLKGKYMCISVYCLFM